MKQETKSIIVIIFIITLFIFSILKNQTLDSKNLCLEDQTCFTNLIKENKNTSLCEYSPDKIYCYEKFALDFNDEKICLNIEKNDNCLTRFAVIKERIDVCQKVLMHDLCIYQIAANTNNEYNCEFAKDSALCYYSFALDKLNPKICEKSEKYKSICYDKISID